MGLSYVLCHIRRRKELRIACEEEKKHITGDVSVVIMDVFIALTTF